MQYKPDHSSIGSELTEKELKESLKIKLDLIRGSGYSPGLELEKSILRMEAHIENVLRPYTKAKYKKMVLHALNGELGLVEYENNGKRSVIEFLTWILTQDWVLENPNAQELNASFTRIIQYLLKEGADPNVFYGNIQSCDAYGSPLQIILASPNSIAFPAGEKYPFNAYARTLIEGGADLSIVDYYGNSIAHLAAAKDADLLQYIVTKDPKQANARNRNNETPLFIAAKVRNTQAVRIFYASGDVADKKKVMATYKLIFELCTNKESMPFQFKDYLSDYREFVNHNPETKEINVKELEIIPLGFSTPTTPTDHLDNIICCFERLLTNDKPHNGSQLKKSIKSSLAIIKDVELSKNQIDFAISKIPNILRELYKLDSDTLPEETQKMLTAPLYHFVLTMIPKFLQCKHTHQEFLILNPPFAYLISLAMSCVQIYRINHFFNLVSLLELIIQHIEKIGIDENFVFTYRIMNDCLKILAFLKLKYFDHLGAILNDFISFIPELENLTRFIEKNPFSNDYQIFQNIINAFNNCLIVDYELAEVEFVLHAEIFKKIKQLDGKFKLNLVELNPAEKRLIQRYLSLLATLNLEQYQWSNNSWFAIERSGNRLNILIPPELSRKKIKNIFYNQSMIEYESTGYFISFLGKSEQELTQILEFLKSIKPEQLEKDKLEKKPLSSTVVAPATVQTSSAITIQKNKRSNANSSSSSSGLRFFNRQQAKQESEELAAKTQKYQTLIAEIRQEIADAKQVAIDDVNVMHIPTIPANRIHTHFAVWDQTTGEVVDKEIIERHKEIARQGTYARAQFGESGYKYKKDLKETYTKLCGDSVAAGYRVDQNSSELFFSKKTTDQIRIAHFGFVRPK